MLRLGLGEGHGPGGSEVIEDVRVVIAGRGGGRLGAHGHGPRGGRKLGLLGKGGREGERLLGHQRPILKVAEERRIRVVKGVGEGVDAAGRIERASRRTDGGTPGVALGEVGGKIPDQGIQGLGAEQLEGVLPLVRSDQGRVGNDL